MKTIFTCLLVSVCLFTSAQQNTFKVRTFVSGGNNYLSQIIELTDGSFVAIGGGQNDDNNASIYLLKTDAKGNVLASKLFNIENDDFSQALVKTSDGGFAVCGVLDSKPALVKFNANLSVQWQRTYDFGGNYATANAVLQTVDGNYVIAGGVDDDANGTYNLLLKTDSQGGLLFAKKYFGYTDTDAYDLALMADGNYAFLTITDDSNDGNDTVHVVKVKPDGSLIWARKFFYQNTDIELASFTASSDGGLVIAGDAYIPDADVEDYEPMMVKYNSAGTLLWSKNIITQGNSEIYGLGVTEDRDGGYLYTGELDTYTDEDEEIYDTTYGYLAKFDIAGNLLWTKTYEPSHDGYTTPYDIISTKDGGYAMCGEVGVFDAENEEYEDGSFIYKLNGNFAACSEVPGSVGTSRSYGASASETIPSGDVIVTNSTLSASLVDFGIVTNICSSNAFPLQLLSFTATIQNKSVTVNWTTANEVNTNYFVVERSANGNSFTALQQVVAKGNSSITQTYSTTDWQPLQGTSYYRLKQVDKDGKTTYSPVASVTVMSNGSIVISPNPVQSTIHAVVQSAANSIATLQVVTMNGNVLATQKTALTTGRNLITISAASLAKGVYMLKVIGSQSTQMIRFVKE